MQIFRSFNHRALAPASVVTIGNFDGVHRGHAAMLEQLAEHSRTRALPSTVLTFEPHPRDYFAQLRNQPELAPARVSTLRDKLGALAAAGVQQCVVLPFGARLAAMHAQEFVERVLLAGLGSRYVLVGDDFRFGAARSGDYAMLQALAQQHGFEAAHMDGYVLDGQRVSSTAVRAALAAGDMPQAQALLGRPWTVSGHVVHGRQLGRQLGETRAGAGDGFRTLNIRFPHPNPAARGIFVVQVYGLDAGGALPAVASLGQRPTLDNLPQNALNPEQTKGRFGPRLGDFVLEVHCLKWPAHLGRENAYGKIVQVEFLQKLHDEVKYPNLTELTQAIARDCAAARLFFDNHQATQRQTRRDRI